MRQYKQKHSDDSLGELVSKSSEQCRHCGRFFLTPRSCTQHENKCKEAADTATRPAEEVDRDVVVDAETYYTVGPKPTAYHVSTDCERLKRAVEAGHREDLPADVTRMVERSRSYVEWHDLVACHECVTLDDSCASVQLTAGADD